METEMLHEKCQYYLEMLCNTIPERCVGSEGNRMATRFFENEISSLGWNAEMPEFEAMGILGTAYLSLSRSHRMS